MGLFSRRKQEKRKHQRVDTTGLVSVLGDVINLSESGAAIYRKGDLKCQPGDQIEVDIRMHGHAVHTVAEVIHIEPLGFLRNEIGVKFIGLSDEQRTQIRQLQIVAAEDEFTSPRAWQAA